MTRNIQISSKYGNIYVAGNGKKVSIGMYGIRNGKFYADLISKDQHVANTCRRICDIANKGLGGVASMAALRAFCDTYAANELGI